MTLPTTKEQLPKKGKKQLKKRDKKQLPSRKNDRKFCIPFSIQARHYQQGGIISLKDFCKDFFGQKQDLEIAHINCLYIRDTSKYTPSIYIDNKPIRDKKLVIRKDRALGFTNDPRYIEVYCDDLNDRSHDYISFRTSLRDTTLINPLEMHGFRDTKEAVDRYIKMLDNRYVGVTDPLYMRTKFDSLTRQNFNRQIVKIIPTHVFCQNISDYRYTKFMYYVKKGEVTPLEDVTTFFTGMLRDTEINYDFTEEVTLEILATTQQSEYLKVFDKGQQVPWFDEEGEKMCTIFSPGTSTVQLSGNFEGTAYWTANVGDLSVFLSHPFGFVCD